MSLDALCRAVESGNTADAETLTRNLLNEGKDPLEMIAALTAAMNRLGDKFARLEIFLPQLVFAGESLKAVVNILRPEIMASDRQGTSKGKVVLGVVKGDLHEIGKNIVKLMLETNGF
ncbi:MAG: B12-binding domain-containing protein, partial [Deltaproteobacteria bacterium]